MHQIREFRKQKNFTVTNTSLNCNSTNGYTPNPDEYDPLCQPYYLQTLNASTDAVVLTAPYTFALSKELGSTACKGQ